MELEAQTLFRNFDTKNYALLSVLLNQHIRIYWRVQKWQDNMGIIGWVSGFLGLFFFLFLEYKRNRKLRFFYVLWMLMHLIGNCSRLSFTCIKAPEEVLTMSWLKQPPCQLDDAFHVALYFSTVLCMKSPFLLNEIFSLMNAFSLHPV